MRAKMYNTTTKQAKRQQNTQIPVFWYFLISCQNFIGRHSQKTTFRSRYFRSRHWRLQLLAELLVDGQTPEVSVSDVWQRWPLHGLWPLPLVDSGSSPFHLFDSYPYKMIHVSKILAHLRQARKRLKGNSQCKKMYWMNIRTLEKRN